MKNLSHPQKWLLLLLCCCSLQALKARPNMPVFHPVRGMYKENLNPYTQILKDRSRSLTFEEVWNLWKQGKLQNREDFELPPRFQRGQYDYWFVFILENTSADTLPILCHILGLNYNPVRIISGSASAFKEIKERYAEDSLGILEFRIPHTFTYNLPPGRRDTLVCKAYDYIMSGDIGPRLSDVRVYEAHYVRQSRNEFFLIPLLMGCLIAIMVYALFRYLQLKEGVFIWYAVYVFSLIFVCWRNYETINPYFLSSNIYVPWTYTKVIHTAFLFIAYANFIRYFLGDTPQKLRRFVRGLTLLAIGIMCIELVLLQLGELYISWVFYYWSRIFMTLAAVAFLPNIWSHPHPLARFMFWGSTFLTFFEILSWFVPSGYISGTAYVGVFIDLGIFSMAMAYRSRLAIREKEQAKAEAQRIKLEKALEAERLRNRIAQDIHDEIGATLTQISLTTQVAKHQPGLMVPDLKDYLSKIGQAARHANNQFREIIFAINPDFDRFKNMQAYFREIAYDFWSESTIEPTFNFDESESDPIVSPAVKQQLLYIFRESQNNIAKHADANHVSITFRLSTPNCYFLEVQDDGNGFVVDETRVFSNGLSGMKKRADRIEAAITIFSAPDEGTTLRIEGCLASDVET